MTRVHEVATIYGETLNNGQGYKSLEEAEETLDPEHLDFGSEWRINHRLFRLVHIPMFHKPYYFLLVSED